VPIAVGELVGSVPAAVRLIQTGAIDYLRLHVSTVGGLTPARKLADLCELTGVQTAWHAPADQSPVGFAANVALDVSSPAFGIQEGHRYPDHVREMFPGTPRVERGYAWVSEEPGWGIDLDERLAARYPPVSGVFERWATRVRRPDGSLLAP
jgi:mannonate dehydratase